MLLSIVGDRESGENKIIKLNQRGLSVKLFICIIALSLTLSTWAGWRSETNAVLDEYAYACKTATVTVDSIIRNNSIKGHITGLPVEAYDKFQVVFYVKTNVWYVHPYQHYQGQEEGYSFSNLNAKGEFAVKSVRRAVPSKELAAVLVPKTYKIKSHKWWLNPALGIFGGVLKYDCAHTMVAGNGDF